MFAKHCGAFARGHVDQHINGADEPALGIEKRCRKRHEVQSRTIGALGDGGDAPYGRLRQDRVSHRTLVVRKERAIFVV